MVLFTYFGEYQAKGPVMGCGAICRLLASPCSLMMEEAMKRYGRYDGGMAMARQWSLKKEELQRVMSCLDLIRGWFIAE